METQVRANVIVVGAGPGGLMAAYCLKAAGCKVTVIERCSLENVCGDVGGAYDISESTREVFHHIGLGEEFDALKGKMEGFTMVNAVSGELFKDAQFNGVFLAGLRRSELQKVLFKAVGEDCLVCGSPVSKVEQNENSVTVTLENDIQYTADFLIGADGIRSSVLKNLFPEEYEKTLKFANCVSYWGFFDYKEEYGDIMKPGYGLSIQAPGSMIGGGVHGDGKEAVWAALIKADEPKHSETKLSPEELKNEAIEIFQHYKPESVPKMMRNTDPEKIFKVHVYDRDPLTTWHKERCLLIGDAAHGMNPFAGQGANMAIIDGFLISTILYRNLQFSQAGNISSQILKKAFTKFEKLRKEPATANLNQARGTADLVLNSGPIKFWMFRTVIWMTPQTYLSKFLFKADAQNHPALRECGIEMKKN